jgi:fumarate reductase subunit C
MSGKPEVRGPWVRPMRGWWRRDRFFRHYMAREATALAVAAYAIVLTVGVVRLTQGEAAWNGWLDALQTPVAMLLHLVMLIAMAVHAKSWFAIMPKTMPMIVIGGQRVADSTITRIGWAAAVSVCVVMFALAWWWRP